MNPDAPTPQPGDDVLGRVRSLLAKAESTDYPAEAEAFTAKAQQLMARHAIDAALLAERGGTHVGGAERRHLTLCDPYAKQQFLLVGLVAEANRCVAVYQPDTRTASLFGARDDLEATELLTTSLLVQATAATLAARPPRRTAASTTAAFRRSFLAAYALRIGERLAEATAAAAREASDATGRDVLPVLARREEAAQQAAVDAFPTARRASVPMSSPEGTMAGVAAADRADLGDPRRRVGR